MIKSIIDKIKYRNYNCLDIRYIYDGCRNIVGTIRNDDLVDTYKEGLLVRRTLSGCLGIIEYSYNDDNELIKEEFTTESGEAFVTEYKYTEGVKYVSDDNDYEMIIKYNKKGYVCYEQDREIIREYEYSGKHISWMKETELESGKYEITLFNIENIMNHFAIKANKNGEHVYTIYKEYNNDNRLIEEGDSRGIVTRYDYNRNGDLVRYTVFDRIFKVDLV